MRQQRQLRRLRWAAARASVFAVLRRIRVGEGQRKRHLTRILEEMHAHLPLLVVEMDGKRLFPPRTLLKTVAGVISGMLCEWKGHLPQNLREVREGK
jgi:hypothetical protein